MNKAIVDGHEVDLDKYVSFKIKEFLERLKINLIGFLNERTLEIEKKLCGEKKVICNHASHFISIMDNEHDCPLEPKEVARKTECRLCQFLKNSQYCHNCHDWKKFKSINKILVEKEDLEEIFKEYYNLHKIGDSIIIDAKYKKYLKVLK